MDVIDVIQKSLVWQMDVNDVICKNLKKKLRTINYWCRKQKNWIARLEGCCGYPKMATMFQYYDFLQIFEKKKISTAASLGSAQNETKQ